MSKQSSVVLCSREGTLCDSSPAIFGNAKKVKSVCVWCCSTPLIFHDASWHSPTFDLQPELKEETHWEKKHIFLQILFPGDEDVPHVQHWQYQCWVQAERGREAGGEADGAFQPTRWPADTTLPWYPGQHQERWETRPTLQCQKNREDEGEGEQGQIMWGGEDGGQWAVRGRLFSESCTCCHTDLWWWGVCVCLCLSVSWMIYECMAGLLLTLSTTAGACHSNMVPHILLSTVKVFHSNIYYPPPPFSTCHYPSSLLFSWFLYIVSFEISLFTLSLSNQRQAKYTENKLKAIKARNEYLLALEATNSCVFKYYIHDLADIIDVSINTSCCIVGTYICGLSVYG